MHRKKIYIHISIEVDITIMRILENYRSKHRIFWHNKHATLNRHIYSDWAFVSSNESVPVSIGSHKKKAVVVAMHPLKIKRRTQKDRQLRLKHDLPDVSFSICLFLSCIVLFNAAIHLVNCVNIQRLWYLELKTCTGIQFCFDVLQVGWGTKIHAFFCWIKTSR